MTPDLKLNNPTSSNTSAFPAFNGTPSTRVDDISMYMMASFSTGFSAADHPLT